MHCFLGTQVTHSDQKRLIIPWMLLKAWRILKAISCFPAKTTISLTSENAHLLTFYRDLKLQTFETILNHLMLVGTSGIWGGRHQCPYWHLFCWEHQGPSCRADHGEKTRRRPEMTREAPNLKADVLSWHPLILALQTSGRNRKYSMHPLVI